MSFPNSAATHDHPTRAQTTRMSSFGAGLAIARAIGRHKYMGSKGRCIFDYTAVARIFWAKWLTRLL